MTEFIAKSAKKSVFQKSILPFHALLREGNVYTGIMIQYALERKYFQESFKKGISIRAIIRSEIELIN